MDINVPYFPKTNNALAEYSLTKNFIMDYKVIRNWNTKYDKEYILPLYLNPVNLMRYLNEGYNIRQLLDFVLTKGGIDNIYIKISLLVLVFSEEIISIIFKAANIPSPVFK